MALEKFHFKTANGEVVLPKFRDVMTFGLARKTRKLDAAEQMFTLVEVAADEKALNLIDQLPSDGVEAFFAAWQKDSGVGLGESGDSSSS